MRTSQEWRRTLEGAFVKSSLLREIVNDAELLEEQLEIYKSDRVVLVTRIEELQSEIDEMHEALRQGRHL